MRSQIPDAVPASTVDEPDVFVCYAHKDSAAVFRDLILLDEHGISVWYDEGIVGGQSWRAEIAAAITRARKFLFYISRASLQSPHCLREVDFALNHNIRIIPVYLDGSVLPDELELVFSRIQALFRHTDDRYGQHLVQSLNDQASPGPVILPPGRRGNRKALYAAAAGAAVLGVLLWQQALIPLRDPSSAAVATNADSVDLYRQGIELVRRWDKEGNLDEAIQLFRTATDIDPEFALALAELADALLIRAALSGDDAALDEAGKYSEAAVRLNPDLAPVQVAAGNVLLAQGQLDLALDALLNAVRIDRNSADARGSLAYLYERNGRTSDADDEYRRAIALDSENLNIRNNYAVFLYAESRLDEAIGQWEQVIDRAPDHFAALVNLGSALSETGKVHEAIRHYERANGLRPTYFGYVNLGTAHAQLREYPAAVRAYRDAIRIDAKGSLAWGNLAFVLYWMNGLDTETAAAFEQAIELAEAARERDPRDALTHSDLALYYAITGESHLALERIETAMTLAESSGEVMAAAAEVYEILGLREQALEHVNTALELGLSRERLESNPGLSGLLADPRISAR